MPFKLNISQKGKAWKIELDSETLVGKKIGDKISGKEISSDLEGYKLEITGATDFAGFPHKADIEGSGIKRVLLTKGWGMHYKKQGLRKRKSLRGSQISEKTVQINLNVLKEGSKKLSEVFPEQNKVPEPEKPEPTPETPAEKEITENKATTEPEKPEPEKPNPEPTPETPEPKKPEPEKPNPEPVPEKPEEKKEETQQ